MHFSFDGKEPANLLELTYNEAINTSIKISFLENESLLPFLNEMTPLSLRNIKKHKLTPTAAAFDQEIQMKHLRSEIFIENIDKEEKMNERTKEHKTK